MPKVLSWRQIKLLELIGKQKTFVEHFYLTGGTPLAAFYLHHRYSEDLDFFSEQEVDVLAIQTFFKKHKTELGHKNVELQQSFNRNIFFLEFPDETVKMEFTFFPFPRIEKGGKQYGIEIDSLKDIAANKLFTIYQRTKARDYIDLYCIIKKEGYTVKELIALAKAKFESHIDLLSLGTQFTKAKEAADMPRMIKEIPNKDWQDFFEREAKKLKGGILK